MKMTGFLQERSPPLTFNRCPSNDSNDLPWVSQLYHHPSTSPPHPFTPPHPLQIEIELDIESISRHSKIAVNSIEREFFGDR